MKDYRKNCSEEELRFLESYDPDRYKKPSVTADIVIFTMDEDNELCILLIRRGGFPYKDHWAIPGGFLEAGQESPDDTARRELFEETGLKDVALTQLYTFGDPLRDPRTHVVSVVYTALVPRSKLDFKAGDDAKDARLFKIRYDIDGLSFVSGSELVSKDDLAFDHAKIIELAIKRLRNRIDYEADAFSLLKDSSSFTIYELKLIFESIKNRSLDTANFRKFFMRNWVSSGMVRDRGVKSEGAGRKPAELYEFVK